MSRDIKNQNTLIKGIFLIIISAFMVSSGQFLWKLAAGGLNLYLFSGFILYGIGAILMIIALKYGDLSILHPMMSSSYVFAFLLSLLVLKEHIGLFQIFGMFLIIAGVIMLGLDKGNRGIND